MDHDEKVAAVALPAGSSVSAEARSGGAGAADSGGSSSSTEKVTVGADESDAVPARPKAKPKGKRKPNNVRQMRIERMMSKAELARRANLSVLTIDRVEKGFGCRMDTKRKILEALGLSLVDRVRVFGEEE